jgi:hypothetical protein
MRRWLHFGEILNALSDLKKKALSDPYPNQEYSCEKMGGKDKEGDLRRSRRKSKRG